jgi:ABC-2 type transport system ATP-binding protein
LRNCSVEIPEGSVAGLVGPNGAGKTTLLHLAVGLLCPTTGSVEVYGQSVGPKVLPRIGFVAQDKPLYSGFTVEEMLRMGAALNPRWDGADVERRLDELGIPRHRRVGKLSGGHHAQVALALALGKRPDLLLLDEPIAHLDPLARREFLQVVMAEVAAGDVTVVLSSHVVADLDRVCDHLVLLSASRVQLSAPVDELLRTHRLVVGPRISEANALRGFDVVQATHEGRQTTAVVRGTAAVVDPAWSTRATTLEELVLAHMSSGAGARPTPTWSQVPA